MAVPPVIDIGSSPAGTPSRAPASSHRLATVSASDALDDLDDTSTGYLHTGLLSLDTALGGPTDGGEASGLERGKVTEIWGPNGAGTTAIALQACANAERDGHVSVWVDCATPLSGDRMKAILPESPGQAGHMKQLPAPTLSHLLASVLHSRHDVFNHGTAILVIDNLNLLVDLDYPRAQAMGSNRTDAQKWQAGRRYAVLGTLVTALNRLAATHDLAVIVTTGCAMRTRPDSGLGGALGPGVGGAEWDAGIWNRLVAFRDFAGRFVGVQKQGGKSLISREEVGEIGQLVGFDINPGDGRLQERHSSQLASGTNALAKLKSSPVKTRKRYFDEVADSEDEDEYGWDANDEDVFTDATLASKKPFLTQTQSMV